jgi:hypothetical protein
MSLHKFIKTVNHTPFNPYSDSGSEPSMTSQTGVTMGIVRNELLVHPVQTHWEMATKNT